MTTAGSGNRGSKAEWEVVNELIDSNSGEMLFFTNHEWEAVEAAASRIIPTDRDPGAREARVIVFIDRYLSGIDYHYASADGKGFLRMAGKDARSARERVVDLQQLYRAGVSQLDSVAHELGGCDFTQASEELQDGVLAHLSGQPKPTTVSLSAKEVFYSRLQGNTDEGKTFFETLCLHVRQGFYADPVYGGNRGRVGWSVIGFPGPETLEDTMNGRYSTASYFMDEYSWEDLLGHYERSGPAADAPN